MHQTFFEGIVCSMAKIAFLAADENAVNQTKEYLNTTSYHDIDVRQAYMDNCLSVAKELITEGVEIIIARGGSAALLKNANLDISVVDIPITGFDLIRSVEDAKTFGRNIAVVTFSHMVDDIDCLASILDIDLKQYPLDSTDEAEPAVLQAFAEGADVVIGGFVTYKAAKKHNFPCVAFNRSKQAILQAAASATNLLLAIKQEKGKAGLIHTVLDFAYEGIISIDEESRITSFNPIAQKICKFTGQNLVGESIKDIWPDLNLDKVIKTRKEELEQLVKVKGVQIICNKVPIVVKGHAIGAVATFQDVTKIQNMEANIRKEIYARGHIAQYRFENILGSSPPIKQAITTAKSFSLTQSNILIIGETGCGKEVFAQSIHNHSSRRGGPFVAVNCAALPSQLLESELFGYVGGAFTGAKKEGKAGLFEIAHKGTIFLDEISEMDYTNQGRLLRVLQERTVVRLGSDRVTPVDVRIIAATNKNLENLIADHKFRDDLYYRLNVLRLKIPPLRDRRKDIATFIETFIRERDTASSRKYKLSNETMKVLENHPWNGNVRELMNVVERLLAMGTGGTVSAGLMNQLLGSEDGRRLPAAISSDEESDIQKALTKAGGKYSEAAKILGISRTTLWRKINKLST